MSQQYLSDEDALSDKEFKAQFNSKAQTIKDIKQKLHQIQQITDTIVLDDIDRLSDVGLKLLLQLRLDNLNSARIALYSTLNSIQKGSK